MEMRQRPFAIKLSHEFMLSEEGTRAEITVVLEETLILLSYSGRIPVIYKTIPWTPGCLFPVFEPN